MKASKGLIGIIGVGVMGNVLGSAILKTKLFVREKIWGCSRSKSSADNAKRKLGIRAYVDNYEKELIRSEIVILCVKPLQATRVLSELKSKGMKQSCLIISIATGVCTDALQEAVSGKNPIIRVVTNTPCMVNGGMTAIIPGKYAKKEHINIAREIFGAVGKTIEVEESYAEALTGLSASGPAYLYLIMEALADGGVRVGLPRRLAFEIVAQTVLGAALMVQSTDRHPASLRDDVTTPGGCTIGALLVLEDGKIRSTLARAVEEATKIAKCLAVSGS